MVFKIVYIFNIYHNAKRFTEYILHRKKKINSFSVTNFYPFKFIAWLKESKTQSASMELNNSAYLHRYL